jgi:hypothetical protein
VTLPPELVAALIALLVAAVQLGTAEVRHRTTRRALDDVRQRAVDAQHAAHADRRSTDRAPREASSDDPPGVERTHVRG